MKSILNRSFKYRTADETSKPGYLAKRFAEIRRQLAAREAKPGNNAVVQLKRKP